MISAVWRGATAVAAAPVLAVQIGLRQRVTEVIFHPAAAREQRAPERELPDIVQRVGPAAAFRTRRSVETGVTGIRRHACVMRVLFVVGHDPRFARVSRFADPMQHALVIRRPTVLQGRPGQRRTVAELVGPRFGRHAGQVRLAVELDHADDGVAGGRGWMMEALPRPLQEIIWLRDVEDLSYDEIAKITDCAPGTVASRLNRALAELERRLRPLRRIL